MKAYAGQMGRKMVVTIMNNDCKMVTQLAWNVDDLTYSAVFWDSQTCEFDLITDFWRNDDYKDIATLDDPNDWDPQKDWVLPLSIGVPIGVPTR